MATKVCEFTVYGDSVPQGSMKHIGKGRVIHSKQGSLMDWRRSIAVTAQMHAPQFKRALLKGPLAVRAIFYATRPPSLSAKTHYKRTAPDLDKLIRSVGDALKHIVWEDDARISGWETWKLYTDGASRLELEIWQLDKHELPARRGGNPFNQQSLFGD